jgi:predicted MFS family arabinose efflux permease
VATNLYITDFMTQVKGISGSQASLILLVCGGIGFFFYVLGGLMGERWGRREVLIGSALWTLLVTFTTPTTAWIIIAVGLALGQWLMLALRRIPPGQELEEIAT